MSTEIIMRRDLEEIMSSLTRIQSYLQSTEVEVDPAQLDAIQIERHPAALMAAVDALSGILDSLIEPTRLLCSARQATLDESLLRLEELAREKESLSAQKTIKCEYINAVGLTNAQLVEKRLAAIKVHNALCVVEQRHELLLDETNTMQRQLDNALADAYNFPILQGQLTEMSRLLEDGEYNEVSTRRIR